MKIRVLALALFAVVAATATAQAEIKIHARVEAFDLMGNPITSVPLGGNFQLRAFVDDVRTSTPIKDHLGQDIFGIFAAYIEASFDAAKVAGAGAVTVAPFFDDIVTLGSVSPGLVLGGGATLSLTNPGSAEQLLYNVPLNATGAGTVAFSPSFFADSSHEWVMYGQDGAILPEEVQFFDFELTIVPEPASFGTCAIALAGLLAVVVHRGARAKGHR